MKRELLSITIVIVILHVFHGCSNAGNSRGEMFNGVYPGAILTIATFNIENLDTAKSLDPSIVPVLAETVRQFDIIAIQEIEENGAVPNLVAEVNSSGNYSYVISEEVGGDPALGFGYDEFYAFVYNNSTVELLPGHAVYTEGGFNFVREPFMAHFRARTGSFDFVLVTIHAPFADSGDPTPYGTTTDDEIRELPAVMSDAGLLFSEPDVICLGDLNADNAISTDFDESTYLTTFPDDQYLWIIPNVIDTTVASTDYTYDRIIALSASEEDFLGTSGTDYRNEYGVFRFDLAFGITTFPEPDDISDHYPVWARFHTDRDGD